MKQIYPPSITGKGSRFADGGSVLDHAFGTSDAYTLGVEEVDGCSSITQNDHAALRKSRTSWPIRRAEIQQHPAVAVLMVR